ncbi:hypothetical protein L861_16720 [Litchfieldella anticariensis FP35 = DSM 16096]|uniref:DUF1835 domain-containing protein n=1 Tax=Litchfieldella anticariensis (strain DSM 16096 / CECT 5854 / CIP 108499 / LMG 22089 / FP35) TaxID=1121939 RepID=S2L1I3_LITA3|nr:DUF1835 domain-containing protein [Halomonas anticariensis]EPC01514.1 hypothetical protein L861_16720 [Halomonas anticariensis FP35 = DSM 16096]
MTTLPRPDATSHGRFNLEQQRKRAKELLKAARADDPDALARLLRHIPPRETPLRLADAQFVIARECGFPSWPRLKAHIESLDASRRLVSGRGDRDMTTLHIRCGSDIEHTLRTAGFQGDFLEFSDPFCIGPVQNLPPAELMRTRAHFLASAFDMTERDSLARLRKSYEALNDLEQYERVVLWFEHDSYDQLILAYLLHRLHTNLPKAKIELVVVEAIPGVERFIGIGQLAPDLLAWLWRQRRPVETSLLELGTQAWLALTADRPEPLQALIATGTPALPMMGRALSRHLQELPAPDTGLGLSEKLTLEIVRDHGPLTVGKTFSYLMREYEPLPYLGDLMFWWQIQPLVTAPQAVLAISDIHREWPHRRLALTDLGRAILEGSRNWLEHASSERWVGGVRVLAPGRTSRPATIGRR